MAKKPCRCKSCGADASGVAFCSYCGSPTYLWVEDHQEPIKQ